MNSQKNRLVEVVLPQLAESLVSATIGKWIKKTGDYVKEYDVLCELITDKVNAELPSTQEGILREILVPEGAEVEVGKPIAVIEISGKTDASVPSSESPSVLVREEIRKETGERGVKLPGGRSERQRYSPAVRFLAQKHGVDVRVIQGTGLGGRVTRKDVLQYLQRGAPNTETVSEPAKGTVVEDLVVRTTGLHFNPQPQPLAQTLMSEEIRTTSRGDYFIPVTPIRNTIAGRMRQSVSEIPHAWTMVEVDVTNLVLLRNKLKDEFMRREGINLTYLAFVLKAVVNAIKDYPIMNSVWGTDNIIVKKEINISLAVGTEEFVMTPVIKNADQKNIAGLAREIDELTKKARSGKLTINDMQGGTFTVNNTGAFGSVLSYPIINYPQAAILTFESIVKRPVVVNDMIAIRSMVNMCLSLDHRILDGVICGRFLQRVKENLENYDLNTQIY